MFDNITTDCSGCFHGIYTISSSTTELNLQNHLSTERFNENMSMAVNDDTGSTNTLPIYPFGADAIRTDSNYWYFFYSAAYPTAGSAVSAVMYTWRYDPGNDSKHLFTQNIAGITPGDPSNIFMWIGGDTNGVASQTSISNFNYYYNYGDSISTDLCCQMMGGEISLQLWLIFGDNGNTVYDNSVNGGIAVLGDLPSGSGSHASTMQVCSRDL